MKTNEIHIRDPFILLDDDKYYLYGSRGPECWGKCTGLDVYVSEDLDNCSDAAEVFTKPEDFWSDTNFWAPEVHKYNGNYYMLVSLVSDTRSRGTQILKSDSPLGPFLPHSDGPVTPDGWSCLDGTLYVENDKPYIIFCHEWTQVGDGEMCALELTDDLKAPVGEPILLFTASQASGAAAYTASEPAWARGMTGYITDGPFMYKTKEGRLLMIWSSFSAEGYCEIVSYVKDNALLGEWVHDERLLFEKDGGHGMLFRDKDENLKFVCHQPNNTPDERPVFWDIKEENGTLYIKK